MAEQTGLRQNRRPRVEAKAGQSLANRAMALIAEGASMGVILDTIVRGVEAEHEGALCSVLLLDESGQHLVHGAAPSLPEFYTQAIDGASIGPSVGSCGTAAFSGERVIVRDIQTDPLWVDFKALAGQAQLASCWSEPIRGAEGRILGAFAMYRREARGPTDEDIRTIVASAHVAAIAIERKQALEALAVSEARAAQAKAVLLEHQRWADMAADVAGVGHWRRDIRTGASIWSDEMYRIYGFDPAKGVPSLGAVTKRYHPDDRLVLRPILDGHDRETVSYSDDIRIFRPDGEIRYLTIRGAIERAPDGEPIAVSGVTMDVTKTKHGEQVLRESEARYRLLAENVTDIIAQMDLLGVITFVTPACEPVLGYTAEEMVGRRILDLMHPDDAATAQESIQVRVAAGPGHTSAAIQYRVRHKDGRWIWIEGQPKVLFDAAGTPIALQDSVRDISERKAAEERQLLLVHELNHRVKNTLATVQSLARQTSKSAADPAAFVRIFEARLLALSHNHDLLTRNSWSGAWVRELVAEHLKPHQNQGGDRFNLAGPEVRLTPTAAVSLGMALGELITNAAKYGALSTEQGTVSVTWKRRREAGSAWLRLVWRELGGPRVTPPTQQGFGRRLIEGGLPRELAGRVQLGFKPRGVTCEIDFPLKAAART